MLTSQQMAATAAEKIGEFVDQRIASGVAAAAAALPIGRLATVAVSSFALLAAAQLNTKVIDVTTGADESEVVLPTTAVAGDIAHIRKVDAGAGRVVIEDRTRNKVPNPDPTSGGTSTPVNWSNYGNLQGLTRTMAYGAARGRNYVQFTFSGTPGATGLVGIAFDAAPIDTPAAQGQVWSSSCYTEILDNTGATGSGLHRIVEASSDDMNLTNSANTLNGGIALGFQRQSIVRTLTNAATAKVFNVIGFNFTLNVPVNFVIRIYSANLVQGPSPMMGFLAQRGDSATLRFNGVNWDVLALRISDRRSLYWGVGTGNGLTDSYTHELNPFARRVRVRAVAGGGGGGGGRREAVNTDRYGGGGGGAGMVLQGEFTRDLFTSSMFIPVVAGRGGSGGAAASGDSAGGGNGNPGGESRFGSSTDAFYLQAGAGERGLGGTASSGTAGAANPSAFVSGGGGAGLNGAGGASGRGFIAGGAGGGGINVANAAGVGGTPAGPNGAFGTAAALGANGADGQATPAGEPGPSGGAGGGGAGLTAAAGNGGNGAAPGGGGGGGGASLNGFASGAGGSGGVGVVEIREYF